MNFQELIAFCKPISVSGSEPDTIGKLRQDSREIEPGDVFIAVKGTKSDGHNFIDEAIEGGASVIISEQELDTDSDTAVLQVKKTRKLLGKLAQKMEGNPADKLTIIGVTGTNGKTTVATLVWQILTKLNYKASLLGTIEKRILDKKLPSRLTTADPIELAEAMREMVDAGTEYLAMEVSSHALDQRRTKGISFKVAVFTNLSHDHLDYHETMNEYASAKKKLFNSLDSKSWAITNADDERGEWIVNSTPAKVLSFSFGDEGLLQARILKSDATGMAISIDETEIETPLVGRFNAYNVVEALLTCTALGIDGKSAAGILKHCHGAPGRMERVNSDLSIDNEPIVFVDYAHTPNALENVLSTLKELKTRHQKLICVFGCGGDRDKTKRSKMAKIAESYANRVVVTSDNPRTEDPNLIIDQVMEGFKNPEEVARITDRKKAIREAVFSSKAGSIVLIAGKGHETYQEINGKRIHFDDSEIVREALQERNDKTEKEGAI
ncbi:UDP-N-acetylmuramoyl-L-alanyl-D-glutamate--2,6-diaminopimelate ligase [Rhodohalobacter sp. 614A]|uniref:UDP-N-acetylmuramoyl-L-alanyl-D-glutamate--2, 6-diaminopimelate ligase n=1 Tax=Rhodohalobacter sp. 614A TaxID=2908649 RepID=UPI001F3CE5A5|nr:UDP-N-acetylmuramoyl-L-alanyl-D-glutamate--2,6-diaminopimelate ligase [Rhodohalobacter sp. 614A]